MTDSFEKVRGLGLLPKLAKRKQHLRSTQIATVKSFRDRYACWPAEDEVPRARVSKTRLRG
jgi:hypothetical protein